jgi:hypothetical protein
MKGSNALIFVVYGQQQNQQAFVNKATNNAGLVCKNAVMINTSRIDAPLSTDRAMSLVRES